MDNSQFSIISKNTNMIFNNSQRSFVFDEYFKTKSFDLCSKMFELTLPVVSIPMKLSLIGSCEKRTKKQDL